jgi:hypothetical protein
MIIRHATPEEREQFQKLKGIWVNLKRAEVLVAEDNGKTIGFLTAHPVWHVEHLHLFEGNRTTKSRAALLLYRSIERIIGNTSVKQMFCFTRREPVKAWADRLGWTRAFKGAATFTKFF